MEPGTNVQAGPLYCTKPTTHYSLKAWQLNPSKRNSSLCEFEISQPFENRAIFFNEFVASKKACFGGDRTWGRDLAAIFYDESNRGPFEKYCGREGDNQLGTEVARLPS